MPELEGTRPTKEEQMRPMDVMVCSDCGTKIRFRNRCDTIEVPDFCPRCRGWIGYCQVTAVIVARRDYVIDRGAGRPEVPPDVTRPTSEREV